MRHVGKDNRTLNMDFISERDAAGLGPCELRGRGLTSKKARSLFDNDVKGLPHYKDFIAQLIKEQGYTCCYCGCRIPLKGIPHYVVEHIEPISETKYSYRLADYFNLLVSCDGGMNDDQREDKSLTRTNKLHCDKAKENKVLPITPTDPDVELHFRYNVDGTVSAANGTDDERNTIKILNLSDSPLLKSHRQAAIVSAIYSDNELLPNDDLEKLLPFYENKDANGKYQPYSFAVANFIHQIIGK